MKEKKILLMVLGQKIIINIAPWKTKNRIKDEFKMFNLGFYKPIDFFLKSSWLGICTFDSAPRHKGNLNSNLIKSSYFIISDQHFFSAL